MAVSDMEVVEILRLLGAAGAQPWIAGGWGVDALVERQTREHRDLDVMVLADHLEDALAALCANGFQVSRDRLPGQVELDDGIRIVKLHPVHPDGSGGWWQATPEAGRLTYPAGSIVGGLVGGHTVRCASPGLARQVQPGNLLGELDGHDFALLAEMLGGDGGIPETL
jgi:lincosamide nucleotidyltransferase A/C/D/E